MVYSQAAKLATYRYREKMRDVPHFKAKIREYNVSAWDRVKSDPGTLERD